MVATPGAKEGADVELQTLSRRPSTDSGVQDDATAGNKGSNSGSENNGDANEFGGIFFKFFLGEARGYDRMSRTDKLDLFKNELLLGLVIAFAQIPESVAFAFLANVEPSVAIHSAWIMGLVCAVFGGRPAMINGATGAFAAIISTFVKEPSIPGRSGEGVEVLFVSVVVAGVFMLIASALNLGRFVNIISYPMMLGFCNGLAIVIGQAQLHPFQYTCVGGNRRCLVSNDTSMDNMSNGTANGTMPVDTRHYWIGGAELGWTIFSVLVSMVVMEYVPKIPHKVAKLMPSSLLAILVAIFIEFVIVRIGTGAQTDTIGDIAPFSADTAFPRLFFLDKSRYPSTTEGNETILGPRRYDLNKLKGKTGQILLQAFLLAAVGLIESLLTQEVVNKLTKTKGSRPMTIISMGAGNIISGMLGGMGGNAKIGLSTINCLNGGKGRLASTFTALIVMVMIMGAYPVLNYVPVSALVGIMLVIVLHTFKWHSLLPIFTSFLPQKIRDKYNLHYKFDRMDILVILLVAIVTYFLNLAYAIFLGVAFSAVVYSWNSSKTITVTSELINDQFKVYRVSGPLFFGNSSAFPDYFDVDNDPSKVEIHFSADAALFDVSSLRALNGLTKHYASVDKTLVIRHLDPVSTRSVYKASKVLHCIELAAGDAVPVTMSDPDDRQPRPLIGQESFDLGSIVVREASV